MTNQSLHDSTDDFNSVTHPPPDDPWLRALLVKQRRDRDREGIKESYALSGTGQMRAGNHQATRDSRIANDAPLSDNRKARRILARYGSPDEIQEFIDEYGYGCSVDDFVSRYRPGVRKPVAHRAA